jgi:M6 family metalloprotease-like protein
MGGVVSRRTCNLLVVFTWVAALAVAAEAGTLQVKRPPRDAASRELRDLRADKWLRAPIKDSPCTRRILETKAKARQFPQVLGRQDQDVLRVCGIRVEFANVPDPAKISGSAGRFDLSDRRSTVFIDPAPHNRKFYLKHMEALANYMSAMSYGKLKLEWEVFPLADDSAYVLPDVGDYNPQGQVGSWTWENLEHFFGDAIRTADLDDDLRFSDYDAFVIIHAGSDWQNDLRSDSPYDLPSFFISLAESIAVDDGSYFVVDGSVVPETSSQDGYLNGINGVLAHEFGHQLGLVDLYDTYTGMSVVGYWDLMDFGSGVGVVLADPQTEDLYYVTGIIPGSLSAFNKAWLGWVKPDTVVSEGTYSLRAEELQGESPNREALVVPLSSYEYFIIENRQCDLDGDSTGIVLSDPSEDSTGVIMGPVNQDREFNYEYDWPLPGSGLLVWHIDRAMVEFGTPYDAINYFPQRRGVTILEAGGIPDLGDYNSFYFLGGPYDPFYRGNNDRVADDTYPNSRSRTGCHTHIEFDQISDSDTLMSLRVSYGWRRDGFPVTLGDSLRFGVPSLLVADVDGDGRDEIEASLKRAAYYTDTLGVQYIEYSPAEIFALEYDASGGLEPIAGWPRRLHGSHPRELVGADLDGDSKLETVVADETGRIYVFDRTGQAYFEGSDTLGAFVDFDEGINGVPVAYDLDHDSRDEVLIATDSVLAVLGQDAGETTGEIAVLASGLAFSQPLVVDFLADYDGKEVVVYTPGALRAYSTEGEPLVTMPVGCDVPPQQVFLAAADLDRKSDQDPQPFEILLVASDGRAWAVDAGGNLLPGWGKRMCHRVVGPPALADLNSDGYLEVILTDEDSQTRAFTWTGARLDGWPQSWSGCALPQWDLDFYVADTTIAVPSAIVADFDGSGVGVFQGSLYECIVGWQPAGERWPGFPLTMGGGCSALAFGDLDGDGAGDLVAGGGDGNLYGFAHPDGGGDMPAPWAAAYFGRARNCVFPVESLPAFPGPGTEVLVAGSFHAFPNPATSDLVTFVFKTETGGRADLEIFDLTGAVVKSVGFDVAGKTESQVDLSDLGNGLYLCRLEIRNQGVSETEFFKLAVKR